MRANPYNNPAPKKQIANVRVIAQDFNSDYAIICFDNDNEEVLHTKAKARARSDFGKQLDSQSIEYKILNREELHL
ncbi:hypothetical protein WAF17_16680 [Bernardetia sp. ABR2-2B]|uniref:hypothetical protein n=1 Tax=Bernardetia sp. ABR2-2B TaxID=3127472 RepID=UPI0030D0420F